MIYLSHLLRQATNATAQQVVITYTSPSSTSIAADLVSQIAALPNTATAISVRANMAELSAAETIVAASRDAFGPHVDILVNNAAVQITRGLRDVAVEDYEKVYEVNVRGVILLTQKVLGVLRSPGRIVNVSSVGARQGFAELSLYCSSKAALEGLTRAWAGELGKVSAYLPLVLVISLCVVMFVGCEG